LRGLTVLGIVKIEDEELAERVPLKGPLVIASNHPAIWDSLLIMRHCEEVSCIMKAGLLSNPLLRGGALFAGFLPNVPRLKMIRSAVERLDAGGQLLLFPEGTRTREENAPLNPFLKGMALIVKQSGVPVLPIFIETNSPYLGKGWPIWKMPDFPVRISLRVGEVVKVEEGETAREFSKRAEGIFRKQLQRG
jgi:1-acyl-sn-glycerol-3-phosphate acyltransferase